MKIYCSRQLNLDNMTDKQIYDWLIGKDLWIDTTMFEFSGTYLKILERIEYSNGAIWYKCKRFTHDARFIFDLSLNSLPEISRPIQLITDDEVLMMKDGSNL